jgi:hypothetical protein
VAATARHERSSLVILQGIYSTMREIVGTADDAVVFRCPEIKLIPRVLHAPRLYISLPIATTANHLGA